MTNLKKIPVRIVEIHFFADGASEVKNYVLESDGAARRFTSGVGFDVTPKRLKFFENHARREEVSPKRLKTDE